MNRILIAKDLPIAQNLEIDQLQVGQIGIFGMGSQDFKMKPVGKLTEVDFLQVYVGGNPLPSDLIDTRNPRRMHWVKTPFHAPVKNVWRFSTSHVPKSMYDTWSIKVKIADRASNQWTLEFSVSKACTSLKELYCEIEKKIDKSPYLSSIADEGGVVIVPNDINHTIQVGASFEPDMRCQPAGCTPVCYDVKEIVEANYGAGSKAHVRDIEFKFRPTLGNHLLEFGHEIPFPQILTDTNGVEEYDLYTGVYGNQDHAGGDQGREVFEMTHTLILAIPKGSQAGTGFQQLMEAQLQRLGIKFAVSPVI